MPNQWFRLYSEFADDPKVQMMSEALQRRLIMLLCNRCKCETLHETQRAFQWRVTVQELAETKSIFMQNGFIDEGWNLLNWNRRQFLSDSSTERVRRYRQGLKQDETLHETVVPVTVTAPEQIQNRTETETETEKPSRKRVKIKTEPTRTDEAKSRHAEFKSAIGEYWSAKNSGIEMPWDAREGKNLEMWLRASPNTQLEQFKSFLRNRYKSAVNHTDRPSKWIGNITSFASSPIDSFGKPMNGSNGHVQVSSAELRQQRLDASFEEAKRMLAAGEP